jgi:hypothetical protein
MEWNGRTLERTVDRMPWFWRSLNWPGRGKIMVGQRQGFDSLFASGIYEISWRAGKYDAAERLPLPGNLDIFGFAYGPVRSAADTDIVAYDSSGYVRILDQKGKEQWSSSERYGGSANFFEVRSKEDPKERAKQYISPPIHLLDTNNDGVQEIFLTRNLDMAAAFGQIRMFKNGRLEAFQWDRLGLATIWNSRDISKYISDFTMADVDGDRKPELLAVVVQNTKHALSKGSSYIAVFRLN